MDQPSWRDDDVRRRGMVAHAVWVIAVAGVVAVILVGVGLTTKATPGDCEGIGFGCSLHGADAAGFAAILVIPIALVVLAIGHVVIAIITGRSASRVARERALIEEYRAAHTRGTVGP